VLPEGGRELLGTVDDTVLYARMSVALQGLSQRLGRYTSACCVTIDLHDLSCHDRPGPLIQVVGEDFCLDGQAFGEIQCIHSWGRYDGQIGVREKARHLCTLAKIVDWSPLPDPDAAQQRKHGLRSIVGVELNGPCVCGTSQFPHV